MDAVFWEKGSLDTPGIESAFGKANNGKEKRAFPLQGHYGLAPEIGLDRAGF